MPRKTNKADDNPFAGLTLEDLDKVAPGAVAASHVGQAVDDGEWPDVIGDPRPLPPMSDEQMEKVLLDLMHSQADLKLAQAQRDAGNRKIEELMDELALARAVAESAEASTVKLGLELAAAHARIEQLESRLTPQAETQETEKAQEEEDETARAVATLQREPSDNARSVYAAQNTAKHPDCLPFQSVPLTPSAEIAASPLTYHAQPQQETQNPGNPGSTSSFTPELAQNKGETGCTGSDAAMLAVTVTSLRNELEVLRHENIRLVRRIEDMGGRPPKRDRAAYMRQYRQRCGPMRAKDPDAIARFLNESSE